MCCARYGRRPASWSWLTLRLAPMAARRAGPQVHTFYEAVGYMIQAQTDSAVQERLIVKFMELPNSAVRGHTARSGFEQAPARS